MPPPLIVSRSPRMPGMVWAEDLSVELACLGTSVSPARPWTLEWAAPGCEGPIRGVFERPLFGPEALGRLRNQPRTAGEGTPHFLSAELGEAL